MPRSRVDCTTARTRIIRAANEYIRANVDQPPYPDQVSAGIGVSIRDLNDAVQGSFGMSAFEMLTRRRLDLVKAAISTTKRSPEAIRAIALRHGFWNLREFDRAYR